MLYRSAGSSMDRASDYGSEGWGFDSLPARYQIGENEGVVYHPASDDSFNEVVSLLAPHRLEEAYGWAPGGDDWDEKEVGTSIPSTCSRRGGGTKRERTPSEDLLPLHLSQ